MSRVFLTLQEQILQLEKETGKKTGWVYCSPLKHYLQFYIPLLIIVSIPALAIPFNCQEKLDRCHHAITCEHQKNDEKDRKNKPDTCGQTQKKAGHNHRRNGGAVRCEACNR